MESCEQAPGLNMLQHGEAVHVKYKELIDKLNDSTAVVHNGLRELYSSLKLPPPEVLERYHLYHDCGKHLVLTIDENGRRQYPNHAEASAKQYAHLFPDDVFTTTLIKMDMEFHTAKGDDLLQLCKNPLALVLYFTAWAEIKANAEMFGGEDSDSFKIKQKRLIQAGKKFKTQ